MTSTSTGGHPDCSVGAAGIQCTSGAIGRANLDGIGVTPRFIDGIRPVDIAVDAGHIYWMSDEQVVGRANLDGTGVEPGFIVGAGPSL